jgi:hypothetical protein
MSCFSGKARASQKRKPIYNRCGFEKRSNTADKDSPLIMRLTIHKQEKERVKMSSVTWRPIINLERLKNGNYGVGSGGKGTAAPQGVKGKSPLSLDLFEGPDLKGKGILQMPAFTVKNMLLAGLGLFTVSWVLSKLFPKREQNNI